MNYILMRNIIKDIIDAGGASTVFEIPNIEVSIGAHTVGAVITN